MQKLIIPLVVLAAGAALGYGIISAFSEEKRLVDLAPVGTVLWIDAPDPAGALAAWKESASHDDLLASEGYAKLAPMWEQLAERVAEGPLGELGLPLGEKTLLRFGGRGVALAALAPAEQPPALVALARVDLVGLARDVAVDGDWRAVWSRLSQAFGGDAATTEHYKGFDVITRAERGVTFHFAMLEDVLVLSHASTAVKAVIDVRAKDAPGVGGKIRAECARLPAGPAARVWASLAFLEDRERVARTVQRIAGRIPGVPASAVESFTGEELRVLTDGLAAHASTLALGAYLPEGDLYRLNVAASRGEADLFRDDRRHDPRTLVGEDTALYAEVRGAYDLAVRFARSDAVAALLDSEAGRWVAAQLEDPQALADMAPPGTLPPLPLQKAPLFEARLGLAVLHLVLQEALGNDVALAIGAGEEEDLVEALQVAAFVRTRPVLRLLTDLACGVAAVHADGIPGFSAGTHGDAAIYSFSPDGPEGPVHVHWTRVGADLVLSNRAEQLQAVIDRSAGGAAAKPSERFQRTLTRLPEGYNAFLYSRDDRFQAIANRAAGMSGAGQGAGTHELMAKLQGLVASSAIATYADESMTSFSVRGFSEFGEDAGDLRELTVNANPQPGAWTALPEGTFLSYAYELDLPRLRAFLIDIFGELLPPDDLAEMESAAGEHFLGGVAVGDVLAAFGRSMGFALLTQERLVPDGVPADAAREMPAVPAALVAVAVRDAAVIEAALRSAIEAGLEMANAGSGEGGLEDVIGALQHIASAQESYHRQRARGGEGRYGTLNELGQEFLLPPELASGQMAGYSFEARPSGTVPGERWMATALPQRPGQPFLGINHEGVIHFAEEPIWWTDDCAMPEYALELGSAPLPGAEDSGEDDPESFGLVEAEVAGAKGWRLKLPESLAQMVEGTVGEGFSPAYAVTEGFLLVASSEAALARAIAACRGEGRMADSATFARVRGDRPVKVASFAHLSAAGLLEQVARNGELLARHAAPAPAELATPSYPEFPSDVPPDELDAAFERYQEERERYSEVVMEQGAKLATWRREHAEANARRLGELLDSLRMLGHTISYTLIAEDGSGLESAYVFELDLSGR